MPENLTGAIERVVFHNLDNGYCVLRIRTRGLGDPVTVVGHLPRAVAGESISASGEWMNDRQHGLQFRAAELRTIAPHTSEGIIRYLSSGLVKGIGPTYARKIVDVFGDRTLDVIEQSPVQLEQVRGIGPKRLRLIRDGWQEYQHVHRIMAFLQSYGIGISRAVKIYKTYGDTAIEQVRSDPYRLSTDIWGVGFRTADELARQLGLPADSPRRIEAAVRHVLREASTHGHVGLPEEVATDHTARLTQTSTDLIRSALDSLQIAGEVIREEIETSRTEDDLGTQTGRMVFLKPLFLAELGVSRTLRQLGSGPHPLPSVDVEKAIAWVEGQSGIHFAPAQRDAVAAALTEKILVLTGGPGTGKTTIVRAVIELFEAKRLKVGLAAPTGRAAKRLHEATGREARTIHRLLEFDANSGTFTRGKEHPLDLDLLVVDEFSMADVVLANQLLRAVPPWASLLLVGDVDQLPSVGPGQVLRDLIESRKVPVVRLTQIHRQAGSSWIVQAAHAINRGECPESAPVGSLGDFYFVEADDEQAILDRILHLVKDRVPARFGLDPFREVQVLAPMNKGLVGVQNLNRSLQEALNAAESSRKEVARYGMTFRVGDKVIQTRNNYQREVFNGDIGRISRVNTVDQTVEVEFEGRSVDYDFADLDELQLAYAISIHKSQGSEYPAVILPLHTTHFIMLQQNLLYTAVTRGKKLVVVVGSRKALGLAVRKADTAFRFSCLRTRLATALNEAEHNDSQ